MTALADAHMGVVLVLVTLAALVYYLAVYIPRPRTLKYHGNDERLYGTYRRLNTHTGVRSHYGTESTTHLATNWSDEVWQNTTNPAVCIFDHHIRPDGTHMWCVGPWSPEHGGVIQNRIADCLLHPSAVAVQRKRFHARTFGLHINSFTMQNALDGVFVQSGDRIGRLSFG